MNVLSASTHPAQSRANSSTTVPDGAEPAWTAPLGAGRSRLGGVAFACWCLAIGTAAAQAQTPSAEATAVAAKPTSGNESTLHEVEIRSSAWSLEQSALASPVQVLEGEALEARRSATLGETLASEPGVQATHFGAGASRPVIRGMDGPRVQVLSGGSAVQDASNVSPDHAVMADSMLAEQIEQCCLERCHRMNGRA